MRWRGEAERSCDHIFFSLTKAVVYPDCGGYRLSCKIHLLWRFLALRRTDCRSTTICQMVIGLLAGLLQDPSLQASWVRDEASCYFVPSVPSSSCYFMPSVLSVLSSSCIPSVLPHSSCYCIPSVPSSQFSALHQNKMKKYRSKV